jgi:bacillithiol disulfide reductase
VLRRDFHHDRNRLEGHEVANHLLENREESIYGLLRYGDMVPIRDVVIVGAGPSGLAAAIACERRGLDYEVIERGVLVDSIYRFPPQMVFFTTPELLEIGGLPFVSPFEKPTRTEALRYYRRVADLCKLRLSLGEAVRSVVASGGGAAPVLEVRSVTPAGERVQRARAVILAIGYYDQPNLLGVPGEDLPHVRHYYSEAHPCYGRRAVVVGGANSAAEAALELYRAGARVTLVHRHAALSPSVKYWVLPDIQNRIKEGSIAARFNTRVTEITPGAIRVAATGAGAAVEEAARVDDVQADIVFLLTGYHTDREFLARCGVQIDPVSTVPCHDPETFETNVPNVFLAGGVLVGTDTAPIFIENGRLHGEKVVAVIASRLGQ